MVSSFPRSEDKKYSGEAMASNSREARRRKILDRGSDRLAFITGQINGVPSPPPSDSTSSLSQSDLQTDQSLPDTIPPRDQILKAQEIGTLSLSLSLGNIVILGLFVCVRI